MQKIEKYAAGRYLGKNVFVAVELNRKGVENTIIVADTGEEFARWPGFCVVAIAKMLDK